MNAASPRMPWLVWQRGFFGPAMSILYGEGKDPPLITGYLKEQVYPGTAPIALTHEQAALPFAALYGLFPPPPPPKDDA